MNMEPVKKMNVHSTAAEIIEDYIKSNDLKSGDKLPSERKLAQMLSIGRSSLREALRKLETVNLVQVENGRGAFVKNPNATIKGINMQLAIEKPNLLQLFQVREVLEGLAIELAIENATDEEIENMEQIMDEIDAKLEDKINPNMEDEQFHRAIYYASKNDVLITILESMTDYFNKLWHSPLGDYSILIDSMPLHRPLFEAIKNRDKKKAIRIFKRLIRFDIKTILEYENK